MVRMHLGFIFTSGYGCVIVTHGGDDCGVVTDNGDSCVIVTV